MEQKLIKKLLLLLIGVLSLFIIFNNTYAKKNLTKKSDDLSAGKQTQEQKQAQKIIEAVLPSKGYQSKIELKDSVVKLVESGVINLEKFESLYKGRGGIPKEIEAALKSPSNEKIILTKENAGFYLNLLWPLGISNHMVVNNESSLNGDYLFNFASTGGWTLGNEKNGGAYFNKFEIVKLSAEQEQLVKRVADNTFRPCCNNSTFFQDCNHGSALLGMLELGASQGLNEQELYREALAFNSFWFPSTYIKTALYFKTVMETDWADVDPKIIMSKTFSSASGWSKNVDAELKKRNIILEKSGGGSCGV